MFKILVVEDEEGIRTTIVDILELADYDVLPTANGKEALQVMDRFVPDLIISDVNMPVMDGITLIRELRSLPNYKFTPLLMLTTESGLDKKTEGKAAGATGWIVKPFNPEQLLAVLKKVIR